MAVPDWADREKVKGDLSRCGRGVQICWFIAPAFAVVGIIGDAANVTPGLEPMSWFLLAIATFLAGLVVYVGVQVMFY
jgi:hypothetical protein